MTNIVGVVGTGPSTRKHTSALLTDWHGEHEITSLILPADKDSFTTAVRHAADWALDGGVPIIFVVGPDRSITDAQASEWLEDYVNGPDGVAFVTNPDPEAYACSAVTHLFLAFDEADEPTSEAYAKAALRKGVTVLDLTTGLYPITDDEIVPGESAVDHTQSEVVAEAEATEPPIAEPPTQPKPRRKRRTKAEIEADKAAALAEAEAQNEASELARQLAAEEQDLRSADGEDEAQNLVMTVEHHTIDRDVRSLAEDLAPHVASILAILHSYSYSPVED